jgi:polyisoprenoid-binding protein YceI
MSTSTSARRFPGLTALAGLVLWGLAACQTSPPPTETAPSPTPVTRESVIPAGARELRVVPEESLLQILVHRGGAMARLGHNHVIASHRLTGAVYLTDDASQTRFDIGFPVNDLTVDEPALREQAGPDFPPGVPQSARDGTHTNLLSEALLDGARYPTIRLRATDVIEAANGYDMGVEISIKDQVRIVRVPVALERREGAIVASGEFPLKQSELGLKPFSIAMGALVVLDDMTVRFAVTAR